MEWNNIKYSNNEGNGAHSNEIVGNLIRSVNTVFSTQRHLRLRSPTAYSLLSEELPN